MCLAPHKNLIGHFLGSRDQWRGEGKSGPSMEPSIGLFHVKLFLIKIQQTLNGELNLRVPNYETKNYYQQFQTENCWQPAITRNLSIIFMSVDPWLCKMGGCFGRRWQQRNVNKLVNGQWSWPHRPERRWKALPDILILRRTSHGKW